MKKAFYILMVLVLCTAIILPVFATDSGLDGETADLSTFETETMETNLDEKVTTDDRTESEYSGEGNETDVENTTEIESETRDIAIIIANAETRFDAIVAIAEAMGVTLEEAEDFLDKMITLGDEHFGESDFWANIKLNILENPRTWTVVVLILLMLVALVIFIIRGLIKNTVAQAAIKANITDIKMVLGINKDTGRSETLEGLKADILWFKKNTERLETESAELKADLELQSAAIIQAVSEVLEAVRAENVKLDVIEGETAASVKITGEQALQMVQLLNIAMGRQMPRMSETTRKAWYDESVARIKEAAGIKEQDGTVH